MIADPMWEVLDVALATPDDVGPAGVDPARRAVVELARRRFGVALAPPYAERPDNPSEVPVRRGGATDGPAVAVVQRRAWRAKYRGLLSDAFLDGLDFSYLGTYWIARAAVSPSPRHRLLVAGRPGEVHGTVTTSPSRDTDTPPTIGEVRTLSVDPSSTRRGLGSMLLAAAVDALAADGFVEATLWVFEGNAAARMFYESRGWVTDGARTVSAIGPESVDEVRYRRRVNVRGRA